MKIGSSSKGLVRVDQLLTGQRISLICSHRKIEYPQREVTNAPQQTIYKKHPHQLMLSTVTMSPPMNSRFGDMIRIAATKLPRVWGNAVSAITATR
jgi:hypothetical protein